MSKETYFENVKTYKYLANKSLGQNFLINSDIAEKIVKLLDLKDDDLALEIGAGLGSLSIYLADYKSKSVLIDVDERMLSYLTNAFEGNENVLVRRGNILKEDLWLYKNYWKPSLLHYIRNH